MARIREGVAFFPGNMALGATGSVENAYSVGRAIGLQLRYLGVNMNLAPVLDVISDPFSPAVRTRSLGDDPRTVAALGVALIRGMRGAGILTVAKHFPGLGGVQTDPHISMPVLPRGLKELERRDLVPFVEAVRAGVDAIMPSHVLVPEIDGELPATLSERAIVGVLRDRLGFDGAVLTDDMLMGGITGGYAVDKACLMALKAGQDMILICRDLDVQKKAVDRVKEALRHGEISQERLDASTMRILRLKERILRGEGEEEEGEVRAEERPGAKAEGPFRIPGLEGFLDLEREICEQSITLVKKKEGSFPLKPEPGDEILVITPSRLRELVESGVNRSTLADKIRELHANTEEFFFDVADPLEKIEEIREKARGSKAVVICTRDAHLHREQAELVSKSAELARRQGRCLIAIGLSSPYDILAFPEVESYIAMYEDHDPSQRAVVRLLLGEIEPRGKLPVSIPGLFPCGHGLTGS